MMNKILKIIPMLLSKVMLFIAFSVFLSSCIGLKSTIEIPKETTKNTETEIAYKEIKPFEPASVWAKRAERKNLQFIYLTIKNNSDKPIRLDKNTLEFFANLQPVKAYSLRKCYLKLNNTPIPGILLGIAGSLIAQEKTTMQNEDGSSYGVTYEYKFNAGAGLVYAASAAYLYGSIYGNLNLYKALKSNYLYGKSISPGETISGIMAIKANKEEELLIRFKKN